MEVPALRLPDQRRSVGREPLGEARDHGVVGGVVRCKRVVEGQLEFGVSTHVLPRIVARELELGSMNESGSDATEFGASGR